MKPGKRAASKRMRASLIQLSASTVEAVRVEAVTVVAGNVPRRLASVVARRGLAALDSLPAGDRDHALAGGDVPRVREADRGVVDVEVLETPAHLLAGHDLAFAEAFLGAAHSLDAQRLAAENYVASQVGEGWVCLPEHYDDGDPKPRKPLRRERRRQ